MYRESVSTTKKGWEVATFNIPFVDYDEEVSTATLRVADAETDANLTTVFDAVAGVSIGNPGQSTLVIAANKDAGSGVPPASAFAQRELKWLVRYIDSVTNRKYRMEIPCADANLLTGNSSGLDLTSGAGAALKSAIEARGLSQDSNAIVVSSVKLVGRNT